MEQKAIFLDRDGVLNKALIRQGKPYAPKDVAELIIPEDVRPALDCLKSLEYKLIVVTNQPDVARGLCSREAVEAINQRLMAQLPLDEVRVCYHDDEDQCTCRKPLPGMLLEAALSHKIQLKKSVMIGDRWRDIDAGYHAGCKTILLQETVLNESLNQPPDFIASSLTQAVHWIKES